MIEFVHDTDYDPPAPPERPTVDPHFPSPLITAARPPELKPIVLRPVDQIRTHGVVIIGTVITHNTPKLLRALQSAEPFVDAFAIVDHGVSPELSAEITATIKVPIRWKRSTWTNFSDARMVALWLAEAVTHARDRSSFTARKPWALIIDSDEWLSCEMPAASKTLGREGGVDVVMPLNRLGRLRHLLADETADTLLISHASGTYQQPRLIKLPAAGKFEGRTHEAYVGGDRKSVPWLRFHDEPKSREEARAKFERDVQILREDVKEPGTERQRQRSWYYLGQSFECLYELGDPDREASRLSAIAAYCSAVACATGWNEEGAWAAFKGAKLVVATAEQPTNEGIESARRFAVNGFARFPIGELAWLIGYYEFQLGRFREAATWAELAIHLGELDGINHSIGRTYFRDLPALYDRPYELAGWAYRKLGKEEISAQMFQREVTARGIREAVERGMPYPHAGHR